MTAARRLALLGLLTAVLSLLTLAVGLFADSRPVEAQSAYAVSNLGQDDDGWTVFSGSFARAQGFETGAHSFGYDIDSVVVSFDRDFSGGVEVSLWDSYYNTDASDRRPNSEVFKFTSPASLAQGSNTFTAPAGSTLEPNATYFVHIRNLHTDSVYLDRTTSADEDSDGLPGWSVWDLWASRADGTGQWPANPTFSSTSAIQLGIVATERPHAVSNLGQDDDGWTVFSGSFARAQGFETGAHSFGYDIDSVVVSFDRDFSGGVEVSLWDSYYNTDASDRRPNSEVFKFTSPASLAQGSNTFTAPAGSTLEPNATYFVHIRNLHTDSVYLDRTTSADEDSDGLPGWSVWDLWASRADGTGQWPANPTFSSTSAIQLGIVATERPHAVSNLGQDDDGWTVFSGSFARAQGFETGAHSFGYDIDSVVVSFDRDFSGGVEVSLWDSYYNTDASDRRPNSEVFKFTSPASLAQGSNTFTAPAGSTLEPNATYFVHIRNLHTDSVYLDRTTSADEDSDGLLGWSVWDLWASRADGTGQWPANPTFSSTSAIQLGIGATERDEPILTPAVPLTPSVEVPLDWSLKPSGLEAGDRFRLIFLSSTERNAESLDINDYNTFVQDAADSGHTAIQAYSPDFRAVACTSAVNAIQNTKTSGTGVPIYWLDGNKAADDYADFYDGTWDEEVTVRDESGTSITVPNTASTYDAWTGCNNDGTADVALGSSSPTTGRLNSSVTNSGPIGSQSSDQKAHENYLYGLSPVFVVQPPSREVPIDWSLKPSGLEAGDRFRLIFLSSTDRNAESTDMDDYNSFVQDAADSGHSDTEPYASLFRAVACTSAVNAIQNTKTSGTGVPIYWLDGNKAADDYADFYDGTWDEEVTARDESGTSITVPNSASTYDTWTGCNNDGTADVALGSSSPTTGRLNSVVTNSGPIDSQSSDQKAHENYFYGLSPVFVVQPPSRVVPSDWALKPSDISPGDEFRLIFLSSTERDGQSTDIDDYNGFVQDRADDGHSDVDPYAGLFRAVACTSAVNAIQNTKTSGTGVPIYWLGGNKAADDYADFYDGTWDEEVTVRDESGTSITVPNTASTYDAWTGCKNDGTADVAMGSSSPTTGRLNSVATNSGPINSQSSDQKAHENYLYGLSPVFAVGVPDVTVEFENATYSVVEGSSIDIKVTLSPDPERTLSFIIGALPKNGGSVADFTATEIVTFNSGDTEKTVTFTALDDTLDDDSETVELSLVYTASGVATGTNSTATVSIIDNDEPEPETPIIVHEITNLRLFVANTARGSASPRLITTNPQKGLQLVNRLAQPFTTGPGGAGTILGTVGIRFGNTAANQKDLRVTLHEAGEYPDPEPGDALCTLKNPGSLTSHSVNTFTAPDTIDEGCPVLELNTTYHIVIKLVSGSGNISIITTSQDGEDNKSAEGWSIGNNSLFGYDGQTGWAVWDYRSVKIEVNGDHVPALVAGNPTAYESEDPNVSTTMTVPIYLDRSLGHTVTVDYETEDETAKAGVNYRHTEGRATFAPGQQYTSFDVEILEDSSGGSTTFAVVLSNPRGAGLPANHRGRGHIADLSTTFRSWPESARESGRGYANTMSFYVSLHRAKDDRTYTIDYATADGTATAGSDYTAQSGTFTFAPGDKSWKLVNVPILDDSIDDSGEHFLLVLSNPTGGAQLHHSAHTVRGTILNDDDPGVGASFPASSHTSGSHTGTDDSPKVVVTFSEAVAAFTKATPSVRVDGATVSSVAGHTESGLENAYIFTLDPEGDGDITFAIKTNEDCDSGGICTTAGVKLVDVPAALTIKGPNWVSKLSVADTTASEEDDSSIDFVVTLAPASDEAVSVDYATADGSATAGGGYTATSGTLTFSAGETSKTVQVPVIDDDFDDDDETFTLNLSNATGAEISDGKATGLITNSEPQLLTARFISMPDSHDGSADISFFVDFSEDVAISKGDFKDFAFTTGNGDVTGANRVNNRSDLWTITVEPDSNEDVTITLPGNRDCDLLGAVCTPGASPRQLSHSPAATVTGPASSDDDEDQEDSTAENNAPTGLHTISGTPQVNETLTADTSAIDDADGLTNVSYSYQWTAGGTNIAGATGSSYTLTASEQGQTIRVRVTFTDDDDNEETLISEATVAVAAAPNRDATGAPTIGGTPQVDQTLTADTAPIDDEDGLTNAIFEYQWIAGGSDIGGATGSTYTLTASEQGQTIQVRVTFTDDAGNAESLTSEATVAVEAATTPEVVTTDSTLTGFTLVDTSGQPQTVLASPSDGGTLTLADPANGSYGIRVNTRSGAQIGSVRLQLSGAKSVDRTENWAPYTLYGDQGDSALNGESLPVGSYTLTATAYSEGRLGGDVLGTLTVSFTVVAATTNTPARGLPTISGTPQVDETLTADTSAITDTDGLANVSFSYQWLADGSDISGATGSSYILTASEEDKTIQVRVSFSDDAANAESLTSAATVAVAAAPTPEAVVTPVALMASFSNVPSSHDGSSEFTFNLSFSENVAAGYARIRDDAFTISDGDNINQARRVTQGSNQHWTIRVKPGGTGDVSITLPVTTDCTATGAICTSDGRKLSNSLSITVSGPGG